MGILRIFVTVFGAFVRSRSALAMENLALRQQLAVLKRQTKRPRLKNRDRIFWTLLSRVWANWRSALLIVQPDTVVRWHQKGFTLYWRWKSRSKPGRPRIEAEIRHLIRRMSKENPSWGTPRIQSELALLGYVVAEATVDKYRIRRRNPPSQTWRSFLDNHLPDIVAIDCFTVPTATFRLLFALIVLRHDRRRVVESSTSTSQHIRLQRGPPNKSSRRFQMTQRRGF